jgi:hypothetical protein
MEVGRSNGLCAPYTAIEPSLYDYPAPFGGADEEFKEVESVTSVFQWRTGWYARTSQWDCRPTAPQSGEMDRTEKGE